MLIACVDNSHLTVDPFVGTGSLLLAAAEFGAYVTGNFIKCGVKSKQKSNKGGNVSGSDIDFLMLHARTRPSRVGQKKRADDEAMKANFEQYDLAHR